MRSAQRTTLTRIRRSEMLKLEQAPFVDAHTAKHAPTSGSLSWDEHDVFHAEGRTDLPPLCLALTLCAVEAPPKALM